MDETILRILQGAASPAERATLDRWRAASAENESQFQETVRVWALASAPISHSAVTPPDVRIVVDRAETLGDGTAAPDSLARSPGVPVVRPAPRRRRTPVRGLALAASVAAVAVAVSLMRDRAARSTTASPINSVESAARTVRLPDGSWIRLAPGARLTDVSTPRARAVRLEGRAFFAVAPDSQRPFTVITGSATARVLGTRFEVRDAGDSVRVVVVEGLVEVRTDTAVARIPAGSMVTAKSDGALVSSTPADVRDVLDWSGLLPFHGTPLAGAAVEIERWSGYRIIITDSVIARRRVTVAFEDEPFADVMAVLCEIADAACTINAQLMTVTVGSR